MFCSCVFAPFFVFSNCCVTFQCSWALITTYYNPFFCELESHIGWLNRRAHFLEAKVLLLQSFSYCKGLWSHNVSFLNQHIPTSHVPHLLPSNRHWVNSHPDCAPCDLETWLRLFVNGWNQRFLFRRHSPIIQVRDVPYSAWCMDRHPLDQSLRG